MEFKVGDKSVHPHHGVGEVTAIEAKEIAGQKKNFYILKIVDSGMKVMVATDAADRLGLRKVVSRAEAKKVVAVLREKKIAVTSQPWNRRYREYMNKIKTGDPLEVAAVLRDLALLKKEKTLSFGERKMYDQAHGLIVQEVAVAKDVDESKIKKEIEKIFSK